MPAERQEFRIKGFSSERMDRLKRFTRSLNAELALLGGEPLDLLEAHSEYQGVIDDHDGTWADLIRRLAAERTQVSYVEEGEEREEALDEFELEDEQATAE
jgi:hypothetical protein